MRCAGYEKYKEEAQAANQRKEELWDEAKHLGGVGDRNADRKIANMEERLQVSHSLSLVIWVSGALCKLWCSVVADAEQRNSA